MNAPRSPRATTSQLSATNRPTACTTRVGIGICRFGIDALVDVGEPRNRESDEHRQQHGQQADDEQRVGGGLAHARGQAVLPLELLRQIVERPVDAGPSPRRRGRCPRRVRRRRSGWRSSACDRLWPLSTPRRTSPTIFRMPVLRCVWASMPARPSTRLMPVDTMVASWVVKKITSRRVTRSKKRISAKVDGVGIGGFAWTRILFLALQHRRERVLAGGHGRPLDSLAIGPDGDVGEFRHGCGSLTRTTRGGRPPARGLPDHGLRQRVVQQRLEAGALRRPP